jgi:polar amino acid transport system substrate-binding protein
MDVANGKIDCLALENACAAYVAARNEALEHVSFEEDAYITDYCMMVMEENKEVYDILNDAIVALKADGTLDKLIETDVKAYIETDPLPAELPVFEGAQTIKIGVTGDLPPMDFVAANGKAAGFNIALLTEIANHAQVNIELVQIETGARAMALASGKVDGIFWTKSITCIDHEESWPEDIEGTLATESYFSDVSAVIVLKAE